MTTHPKPSSPYASHPLSKLMQMLPPVVQGRLQHTRDAWRHRFLARTLPYRSIDDLVESMDEHHRRPCKRFLNEHFGRFTYAPGSRHNHQAWVGGYQAHVAEVMNLAAVLYRVLNVLRPLPFSLSSLLFVLFWHDAEKPFLYESDGAGGWKMTDGLHGKATRATFRLEELARCGGHLTPEEATALRFVEGENEHTYSGEARAMNELGALAHACDVLSARLWHTHPQPNDAWDGSRAYADQRP